MSVEASKRLFTVHEYYRMAEAGILSEDDRVELIEGEIVQMTPMQSRHASCVTRIMHGLVLGLRERAIVTVQNPVRLGPRSEPQPDCALVRHAADAYRHEHPTAKDVLLLIEVSHSTLRYDLEDKARLYATHGIPEYWVVDLVNRRVVRHRAPGRARYGKRDEVASGALPLPTLGAEISLADLF